MRNSREGVVRFASARNRVAATLGVCVVAVIQLLTVSELDRPLTIGLYCFGAAIPLIAGVLVAMEEPRPLDRIALALTFASLQIGMGCAYVGGAACFFHFSNGIGAAFLVAGALATVLVNRAVPDAPRLADLPE